MTVENEGVQDNNQNAGNQNQGEAVKSAYDLYDAADQAYEAYQADPENAELKTAYDTARKTAKETAAAERKATAAPKEYKLTKPEKSLLSDESVVKIAAFAREHGLTQKQAEAQINRESQVLSEARQAYEAESQAKLAEVQESWIATAQADKEYGGTELPKNVELAKRVLEKYGTPEFKAILEDPKQGGFGNHPELVRVLVRIGRAMSEDQLVAPGAQGGKKAVSAAEKLFGEGTVKGSGVQN